MSTKDTFTSLLERAQSFSDYVTLQAGDPEHGPPLSEVLSGLADIVGVSVDDPFLVRRLSWDGLGPDLKSLHSSSSQTDEQPWWQLMVTLCREPVAIEPGHPADPARQLGAVLLPEVWAPFVAHGLSSIREQLSVAGVEIASQVEVDLCASLYRQLDRLLGPCLSAVFDVYRTTTQPDGANGRGVRGVFIDACLSQAGLPVFGRYPVVARCAGVLIQQWVRDSVDLLFRYRADKEGMVKTLFDGRDPGELSGLSDCDSDRHHGGRMVRCLTFENGQRVVYKPRPVEMEAGFRGLVDWLNARGTDHVPPAPRVYCGVGYGWLEFVEHADALEEEGLSAYFRSAGGLLALVYVLSGTDCHMDNVIATTDGPALIDAEMLMQPRRNESARAVHEALGTARALIDASVVSTGLIQFTQTSNGRITDAGGLSGAPLEADPPAEMIWEEAGTDRIRRVARRVAGVTSSHLPYVDGVPVSAADHVEDLVAGFRSLLSDLIAARSDWLSNEGPLSFFADASVRLVFRSSQQYAEFMELMMAPRAMGHGLKRSLFMERVGNQFGMQEKRPVLWPFFCEERRAIEAMDIPCFRVSVQDVSIDRGPDGCVDGYLTQSGFARVRERVESVSTEDIEKQEILIRSLLERQGHVVGSERCSDDSDVEYDPLDVARRIGDLILSESIQGDDGSMTWIEPSHIRASGSTSRGAAFSLYTGVTGVALYLAELSAVTQRESYREAAEKAIDPLRMMLQDARLDAFADAEPIGACEGLSGIAYGLGEIGRLLGVETYRDAADSVLALLTPERIRRSGSSDVQSGLAGAILVMLGRSGAAPLDVERAVLCGEELAGRAQGHGDGLCWRDEQDVAHVGFAHGAAGIGLAFARLYAVTEDVRWLDLADRAFSYERERFDHEAGHWPLQGVDERVCMNAWCHGAAGIALSRAEALSCVVRPDWELDLEQGIRSLADGAGAPVDFLCCGASGLASIVSAIQGLRPELAGLPSPRGLLATGVAAWAQSGSFRFQAGVSSVSLFRGLAGIGHAALRVADAGGSVGLVSFRAPAG